MLTFEEELPLALVEQRVRRRGRIGAGDRALAAARPEAVDDAVRAREASGGDIRLRDDEPGLVPGREPDRARRRRVLVLLVQVVARHAVPCLVCEQYAGVVHL